MVGAGATVAARGRRGLSAHARRPLGLESAAPGAGPASRPGWVLLLARPGASIGMPPFPWVSRSPLLVGTVASLIAECETAHLDTTLFAHLPLLGQYHLLRPGRSPVCGWSGPFDSPVDCSGPDGPLPHRPRTRPCTSVWRWCSRMHGPSPGSRRSSSSGGPTSVQVSPGRAPGCVCRLTWCEAPCCYGWVAARHHGSCCSIQCWSGW